VSDAFTIKKLKIIFIEKTSSTYYCAYCKKTSIHVC